MVATYYWICGRSPIALPIPRLWFCLPKAFLPAVSVTLWEPISILKNPSTALCLWSGSIETSFTKERSEQASQRDFLTGLLNRGAFHEIYAKEHELAQRKGLPLTLVELDMDHFKQINDVYGHAMGDLVLQKVSEILKYTLRPSDFIARWGGEEMAILMPATDQAEALAALLKCQKIAAAGL